MSSLDTPVGAVCDRLFCLTVAWEFISEAISLEGGSDTILREPVIAILVHSPAGWVLLETGLDPRHYHGRTEHPFYPAGLPEFPSAGDPLIEALAQHGVAPDDLVVAAVSHLHLDHTGGLHHLAAAGVEVAIQRRELEFGRRHAGTLGYLAEDYENLQINWRVLDDGDAEIAPGITALWTPGHTPGHMSYRVQMAESGAWLFAVDAIDLQRGIDEDRCIGWSADPADAPLRRTSHDRLVAMAAAERARLVPGHCPETWPSVSHADGYR